MADNLTLPATGSVVRTIDNTGVHTQVFRADGSLPLDTVTTGTDLALMVAGVRRDADTTPVSATGDMHPLVFDEAGRLKVAAQPGSQAPTTGSITASAQSVAADVSRTSNITFHVTGTFAGHNVTFEGSIDGGTTYFAVQAVRTNANTIELVSGALSAAPAYGWEASVNGLTNFRVRATAHTSGTANWRIQPAPYATEPIPAAQVTATQTVDTELPAAAALADGASNPTTPTVGAAQMLFNGSTLDRERGNFNTTTGDTGAKTATGNGATQTNYNARGMLVVYNIGAVSGTAPTLVLKLQHSPDGGTTWYDIAGANTVSITAPGVAAMMVHPNIPAVANGGVQYPLARTWRVVWTIGGTTPSFTITNIQVEYFL